MMPVSIVGVQGTEHPQACQVGVFALNIIVIKMKRHLQFGKEAQRRAAMGSFFLL